MMKKRIKAIRAKSGLSQAAFAEKYKIPQRTYESWEMGTRAPAEYVIELLEKVVDSEKERE